MSDNAPDLTQKVLGFRQFLVVDDGLCTIGVGRFHWLPGPNHARCLRRHLHRQAGPVYLGGGAYTPTLPPPRHDAPATDCQCGLYGYHEPQGDWLDGGLGDTSTTLMVAAAIRAWGRMEIHRNGYRAQYAEVVLIAYDPFIGLTKMQEVQRVASRFGVRAVDIESLEREARKLGTPIHKDLLPTPPEPPETKQAPKQAPASMPALFYPGPTWMSSWGSGGAAAPVMSTATTEATPEPTAPEPTKKAVSNKPPMLAVLWSFIGLAELGFGAATGAGVDVVVGVALLAAALVAYVVHRYLR